MGIIKYYFGARRGMGGDGDCWWLFILAAVETRLQARLYHLQARLYHLQARLHHLQARLYHLQARL